MNKMAVAVRYYTKTGNTKKLAEQIAEVIGCQAQTMDQPVKDNIDLLFLGASVYWGGVDKEVKEFIRSLDSKKIGKVVVFSTSALAERAYPEISKLLMAQGIPFANENFYCRGQFKVIHRDKPDNSDFQKVRAFVREII